MGAFAVARQGGGIVRCARQQDGRPLRSPGDEDDRVQLDAVPHGDHHIAAYIIQLVGQRRELRRRLARQIGIGGRRTRLLCGQEHRQGADGQKQCR